MPVDPELPQFEPDPDLQGTLTSTGSDTLANLMTLWTEAFQKHQPEVTIQVQAAGSSTAPPALTQGTVNIGPMSRPMKDNEIAAFQRRYGYRPTAVRVAIDAFAVYVHRDNPIDAMSLDQLDAIFSANRRCGSGADIESWGQLGLDSGWRSRRIQLYGRNSVSGSYGYFKQQALCSGDFKNTVNEQPGSASVVQAVGASLAGIGYSGIGYRTSSVKAIALRQDAASDAIAPTAENALSGRYPLWRYLYVYINKRPDTPLLPVERAFLQLVLSREGQAVVLKDGYVPLPAAIVLAERQRLEL
jgi:phosphate transport system substrate-binding protein